MQKGIILTIGIIGLTATLAASAADAGEVLRREGRQRARIRQGVAKGELTPGETKALRHEQRHIERTREQALADGKIGPQEHAKLEREQDRASLDIYQLKHNNRAVPPTL
jgi:hypothetical protein